MKYLLFLAFFLTVAKVNRAQVGIGTSTPNSSAMLDISATNKGLLIPRVTTALRIVIPSPATGLQVFDTDTKSFWYYNGTVWVELSVGSATNFWSVNGGNIFNNNAGNVGIGLNTPSAPLHVKAENEALRIQGTTPYLSFYDNANVLKGFLQSYNSDLYLGTPSTNTSGNLQFYTANNPVMTLAYNGSVGIGTTAPLNKFQIGDAGYGGFDFAVTDHSETFGIDQDYSISKVYVSTDVTLLPKFGGGNVGINVAAPQNKLQIGSMGASNFSTNDFAIGNGANAMAILQSNASTLLGSTTDIVFRPRNDGTGNVGINVLAPANKLQIGSVGATGFATNDLAIGNGVNAMAVYQTNDATLIGSTTDIVLKPRNNGHGRVGINTNTPIATLDVADYVLKPGSYYTYLNRDAWSLGVRDCQACLPAISIYATNAVYAAEFDAFSDARIKEITGISNSSCDLATVNALRITDYTMKDKVKYGDRTFKKIIAQDVEKVYPQVVSKHAGFVPNVYQVTSKVEKTRDGFLLTFAAKHNISKGAKKLRVLMAEGQGMEQYGIVSIVNDKQVLIKASDLKMDKIFVYGEDVDDFRTVDYEGLTTLNISATQELSRLLKNQAAVIERQQKQLDQLLSKMALIEAKPLLDLAAVK